MEDQFSSSFVTSSGVVPRLDSTDRRMGTLVPEPVDRRSIHAGPRGTWCRNREFGTEVGPTLVGELHH